jgi:hypothetical protein
MLIRRTRGLVFTLLAAAAFAACVEPAGSEPDPSGTIASSPGPSESTSPASSPLPDGLEDRTWYTQLAGGDFVAGTLASSERITLPAGTVPIAIGGDRVAVVEAVGDPSDLKTTVSVTRMDGSSPVTVTLDAAIGVGVFAGDELIVSGGSRDDKLAPGVYAIGAAGGTRTLLPEGPVPEGWSGQSPSRSLVVSDTGKTLIAGLCAYGRDGCEATILTLPGGETRGVVHLPGYPRPFGFGGATDGLLLFGLDPATRIGAVGLETGKVLWHLEATSFWQGYLTGRGALIQQRYAGSQLEVIEVDLATGSVSVLVTVPAEADLTLWPELSTDSTAVLGTGGRLSEAGMTSDSVQLSTVDLDTGEWETDAYSLVFEE